MNRPAHITASVLATLILLSSCTSTRNLELETTFPVPLMDKMSVRLGVHLDEEILSYVYHEEIEKKGEWNVELGSVQTELFDNLARGLFEAHALVDGNRAPSLDGVLKPSIVDLQFSLPTQTRSNFYEVWIRYNFELYDSNGNRIGDWPLPAYGKASKKDFGSASAGVEAAAIAACRDAMAFFALNFGKVPTVRQWLADGKPQQPPPPVSPPVTVDNSGDNSSDNSGDSSGDGNTGNGDTEKASKDSGGTGS